MWSTRLWCYLQTLHLWPVTCDHDGAVVGVVSVITKSRNNYNERGRAYFLGSWINLEMYQSFSLCFDIFSATSAILQCNKTWCHETIVTAPEIWEGNVLLLMSMSVSYLLILFSSLLLNWPVLDI